MTTITERRTPAGPGRHRGRGHRLFALISLGALALAGAGAAGTGAASADTPTVLVGSNASFGTILTTASGMALYTLDTDHNGQSTCHGSCAAVWPPLNVPAGTTATAGPGVTGTVATATQSNGTSQVTYNGSPLYTFVGDSAPGQVTGNGVSGFFVVTVSPAATTTTTTTPAGSAPTGTAAPSGTPGTPAPGTSASGPPSATAASGTTAPAMTSATPGALAFTGAGPGLLWLVGLGLFLLTLGALLAVSSTAGRMRRVRSSVH
jgi:predicted lipoprotein with Yx(FWY)xxD motif